MKNCSDCPTLAEPKSGDFAKKVSKYREKWVEIGKFGNKLTE